MTTTKLHLLIADDDTDDCIFYREILDDLPLAHTLAIVRDGVELMYLLTKETGQLPSVIFLDLNMPRKTGYECLLEIKSSERLKHIPVIIISTSFDHDTVNLLYEKGADHYIRKPAAFSNLKHTIHKAISLASVCYKKQPGKENFIISVQ